MVASTLQDTRAPTSPIPTDRNADPTLAVIVARVEFVLCCVKGTARCDRSVLPLRYVSTYSGGSVLRGWVAGSMWVRGTIALLGRRRVAGRVARHSDCRLTPCGRDVTGGATTSLVSDRHSSCPSTMHCSTSMSHGSGGAIDVRAAALSSKPLAPNSARHRSFALGLVTWCRWRCLSHRLAGCLFQSKLECGRATL